MRKRLVYRCDDIGYTKAFDMGAFKALDEGIGTSADVMLDAPHAKEALQMLKERPWISVGWHRHLWESPVLSASEVPSLVDAEGRFRWRHNRNDLRKFASYEDAYKEFEAELAFCKEYLGRYPDTVSPKKDSPLPLEQAYYDICVKYDLNRYFLPEGGRKGLPPIPVDEKWKDLDYHVWYYAFEHPTDKNERFDLSKFHEYDPSALIKKISWQRDGEVIRTGGHPGYLDEHILKESTCSIHRVKDLQAAVSDDLKKWIIENKIELVSQTDVLYGENKYQDHLKEIGSPLWIGNMQKEENYG